MTLHEAFGYADRIHRDYILRILQLQEAEIQRVRDEALASGALPGEFTVVQVWRGVHMREARIA